MSKIQDLLQMTTESAISLAHSQMQSLDIETMGETAYVQERKRINIQNIYAPNLIRRLSKRFEGEWTDADTEGFYEVMKNWDPRMMAVNIKAMDLTKTFYESDQAYEEEENINTLTLDDYRRKFGLIKDSWVFGGK